jgi:rSAM/selenodomain-associated transferase 1
MSSVTQTLMVFAKAPLPGAVKTRLIPLLGAAGAARAQQRMIRHALTTAALWRQARGGKVELWCAPGPDDAFFAACAEEFTVELKEQQGGDLGARMWLALCGALAGGAVPLLIGTDCPWLTAEHLGRAQQALAGADAVFTPAADGGYVLTGLRRAVPELFTGIAWGGSQVMTATRARARLYSCRLAELEILPDVDTPADWARLAADPRLAHLANEGAGAP